MTKSTECASNVSTFSTPKADITYLMRPISQESTPISPPIYTDSVPNCSSGTLKYLDGAGVWTPVAIGLPSFVKTFDSAS